MTTISSIWSWLLSLWSSLISLIAPASKEQAESCLHWSEIGLIVMSVVVAIGVYGENRKKWALWHFVFEGLVVFGVTGEFIEDAIVWRSTEKLQSIDDAELSAAENQAAAAINAVAVLGVAFDTLPAVVEKKKKEVEDEIRDFEGFTDANKREVVAAVAELNADKEHLNKARAEAQAAAREAEAQLAAWRVATAPRTMTIRQQSAFVEVAQQFSGFGANVLWFASSGQDADPLGTLISTLLKKAQWNAVPGVISVGSVEYVHLCIGANPTAKVAAAANALIGALGNDGIQAVTDPTPADSPFSMETIGAPVQHPDMTIVIGAK